MATINTKQALAQFDDLVARGELLYSPSKPIILTDSGLDYDLRTIPSFASKPAPSPTSTTPTTTTAHSTRRPPPTDGSDIDHADPLFFVSNILTSHKLILNKFCVYRPQHLLVTRDPTRRQWEALDEGDVRAVWAVLGVLDGGGEEEREADGGGENEREREREREREALKGARDKEEGAGDKEEEEEEEEERERARSEAKQKHYAIYNGGRAGGSSRQHKHMQVLARPKACDGDLELLPYRQGQMELLPIVGFFSPLDQGMFGRLGVEEAGRVVFEIVARQWRAARDALREWNGGKVEREEKVGAEDGGGGGCGREGEQGDGEEETVPHNVIITQDWVITIPRRAATIEGRLEGHVVGSQGVLGSVWCAKEEQLEAWKAVGLGNVLVQLGIPGRVEYC